MIKSESLDDDELEINAIFFENCSASKSIKMNIKKTIKALAKTFPTFDAIGAATGKNFIALKFSGLLVSFSINP